MNRTAEAAKGKWSGILAHFGVSVPPRGKHGPCPVCDGKDRFRFDDKDGRGTSICNHCGARDGFQLVEAATGRSFGELALEVDRIVGNISYQKPAPEMSDEQVRQARRAMWDQGVPVQKGDPVDIYLTARGCGLDVYPKALRTVPMAKPSGSAEAYPMMLALVESLDGSSATIHRTFISGAEKAPIEKPRLVMPGKFPDGGFVRLGEPGERIGIAEGIETALAASKKFGLTVWAALSAQNLVKWRPPEGVKQVMILGDNDISHTGHAASYSLSRSLRVSGVETVVYIPELVGTDWADASARGWNPTEQPPSHDERGQDHPPDR